MPPRRPANARSAPRVDGGKPAPSPPPPTSDVSDKGIDSKTVQSAIKALELIVLAAIYSPISQLSLSPVYGSIPPSVQHPRLLMASVLLAWIAKSSTGRHIPKNFGLYLPIHAFLIPAFQFYLFQYSGAMGATYGPLIIELLTYFPLAVLSVYTAATAIESIDLSQYGDRIQNSGPAIVTYFIFSGVQKLSTELIRQNMGSSLVFTRSGLQFVLATFYALLLPSKALMFAILPILHFASVNVHAPLERTTALLNSTLHTYNYSLVARQESLTGYISVLDSLTDNFRVMRCDHSLLGGEWTFPQKYSSRVKEPIYSVFTILEAVRLVETESRGQRPVISDDQTTALVIGLGIGTTPSALIAHGIQTTIVEIDPVVHSFAMQYFALPTNHTSIIDDAVVFVEKGRTIGSEREKYNYIVHDVFTGGAEPANLFTQEFLQGLSESLKPDGVIAINYAGDLLLPSASIVVDTVKSVFPSCRFFREELPVEQIPGTNGTTKDFTNMVMFCHNSEEAFTFRNPVEADYLGSQARRFHLLPKHEIAYSFFAGRTGDGDGKVKILRKGKTQALEVWQRESAVGHWGIMRTVLPDVIWENW